VKNRLEGEGDGRELYSLLAEAFFGGEVLGRRDILLALGTELVTGGRIGGRFCTSLASAD